MSCDELRDIAAELALDVLPGQERAVALDHLAQCTECARHVERLSTTADAIVASASHIDPPLGFETRALERMTGRAHRRVRRVWLATAAAVVALLGVGTGVLVTASRNTTSAAVLRASGGRAVGHVYLHTGGRPWVFVDVEYGTGTFDCAVVLVDRTGTRELRGMHMTRGVGSWGTTAAVDGIREVRITWPGARAPYVARI